MDFDWIMPYMSSSNKGSTPILAMLPLPILHLEPLRIRSEAANILCHIKLPLAFFFISKKLVLGKYIALKILKQELGG